MVIFLHKKCRVITIFVLKTANGRANAWMNGRMISGPFKTWRSSLISTWVVTTSPRMRSPRRSSTADTTATRETAFAFLLNLPPWSVFESVNILNLRWCTHNLVHLPGTPSDLNTGNRTEGATGCPSWCRPLRPLFLYFLCSNLKANPVVASVTQ